MNKVNIDAMGKIFKKLFISETIGPFESKLGLKFSVISIHVTIYSLFILLKEIDHIIIHV